VVWTDASKIALGSMLEINGKAIEDATWLRKKEDFSHINVAELEAVLKGVNLALKWGMTSIELRIDSATVAAWLQSVVSAEKR
ncbi:Ribonuclease H-like domain, partial [Trinorchestia longiramus]